MSFMQRLAERNGIKIIGFEKRTVAGSARTYPKYAEGEARKLTETMMAKEVYREVFGREISSDDVVDSKSADSGARPTTATNATDVTREKLAARIRRGDFKEPVLIGILTDQPYVGRQVISNKRAVSREMEALSIKTEIIFEGMGDPCEAGVTVINSEFAALTMEGFLHHIEQNKAPRKCDVRQLSFQDRCKDVSLFKPMPTLPSAHPSATSKQQVDASAAAQATF